jgi:hypothetical protein
MGLCGESKISVAYTYPRYLRTHTNYTFCCSSFINSASPAPTVSTCRSRFGCSRGRCHLQELVLRHRYLLQQAQSLRRFQLLWRLVVAKTELIGWPLQCGIRCCMATSRWSTPAINGRPPDDNREQVTGATAGGSTHGRGLEKCWLAARAASLRGGNGAGRAWSANRRRCPSQVSANGRRNGSRRKFRHVPAAFPCASAPASGWRKWLACWPGGGDRKALQASAGRNRANKPPPRRLKACSFSVDAAEEEHGALCCRGQRSSKPRFARHGICICAPSSRLTPNQRVPCAPDPLLGLSCGRAPLYIPRSYRFQAKPAWDSRETESPAGEAMVSAARCDAASAGKPPSTRTRSISSASADEPASTTATAGYSRQLGPSRRTQLAVGERQMSCAQWRICAAALALVALSR